MLAVIQNLWWNSNKTSLLTNTLVQVLEIVERNEINNLIFQECQYIWTPYNDEEVEGKYVNYYTKEEISIDWEPAQPNGDILENHIVLIPGLNKLRDVNKVNDLCVSCTVSHKIATLRGFCKHSYLGKKPIKGNFLNNRPWKFSIKEG